MMQFYAFLPTCGQHRNAWDLTTCW